MPQDALTMQYLAQELDATLNGGVIAKISMPYKDEIVLSIRSNAKPYNLVISACPMTARLHLTENVPSNPAVAQSFLMHLRKHIGGAKIVGIAAVPYERVVVLRLQSRNELGDTEEKRLYAEIMGKYSNIILVDGRGVITESIKHVTGDVSGKRIVLAGVKYSPAPPQNKSDIRDRATLMRHLSGFTGGKVAPYLLQALCGLSPVSVNEAVVRALGASSAEDLSDAQAAAILDEIEKMYDFSNATPYLMTESGAPKDFTVSPYISLGLAAEPYPTLSAAMDAFFRYKATKTRFDEKAHALLSVAKTAYSHAVTLADNLTAARDAAADYERDRICGELLTANLYKVHARETEIQLDNYYTGKPETVTLDPKLSPAENAQRYYKRYAKKKRTFAINEERLTEALARIDYLASLVESFALCSTENELEEIRDEMVAYGLIKPTKAAKKKVDVLSSPLTVDIDGYTVYIGKNNAQNDRLVRAASDDDMWLHTLKIHGAHVVVKNGARAPDGVIQKAAAYAAYYSKARESCNVPVDYTLAKYVSKPKGAPLGKVIYTNQRTVYVTPTSPTRQEKAM